MLLGAMVMLDSGRTDTPCWSASSTCGRAGGEGEGGGAGSEGLGLSATLCQRMTIHHMPRLGSRRAAMCIDHVMPLCTRAPTAEP